MLFLFGHFLIFFFVYLEKTSSSSFSDIGVNEKHNETRQNQIILEPHLTMPCILLIFYEIQSTEKKLEETDGHHLFFDIYVTNKKIPKSNHGLIFYIHFYNCIESFEF